MKILKWIKENWLFIIISILVFIGILYFSGAITCWTGGYCPPATNCTG